MSAHRPGGGAQGEAEQLRGHLQVSGTQVVPGGLLTLNIARDYFNYEDNATRDIPQDLKIIADYSDPVGRRPVSGVSWYFY